MPVPDPASNEARSPSFLGRLASCIAAGALAGLVVGAVEAALVVGLTDVSVGSVVKDMIGVEINYLAAGVGVSLLAALLRRRLRVASVAGVTAGVTTGFVAFSWMSNSSAQESLSAGTWILAVAGGVVAALASGWLVGRMARKPVLALAHAGALLLVSVLWVGYAKGGQAAGADLAIERYPESELPPNIVMILVDTLRADRLSCYGYERPTSPNIDALAAKGTRFAACYAQAPWTRPSVASLMTGLYPSSHGTVGKLDVLQAELPSIAQVLQARGYHTAGFSANPQVSTPFGFHVGFDVFGSSAPGLSRQTALGRLRYVVLKNLGPQGLGLIGGRKNRRSAEQVATAEAGGEAHGATAAALNQRVLKWLPTRPKGEPVFLYLQYIDPHVPYDPPVDLLNEGPVKQAVPPKALVEKDSPPYPLSEGEAASPEDLEALNKLYDAEIRYCDEEIGRLLARLEKEGILDHAYVIVVSDHGEEFFEHKKWLHGQSLFDELVAVPCIVTGPDVAVQVVDEPIGLVDWLPTLNALSGAHADLQTHGVDLTPALTGGTLERPNLGILSERPGSYPIHGMRLGDRKVIRIQADGREHWLEYDLAADRLELANLAEGKPTSMDLARTFLETVSFAESLYRGAATQAELSEDTEDDLEALGYAGDE